MYYRLYIRKRILFLSTSGFLSKSDPHKAVGEVAPEWARTAKSPRGEQTRFFNLRRNFSAAPRADRPSDGRGFSPELCMLGRPEKLVDAPGGGGTREAPRGTRPLVSMTPARGSTLAWVRLSATIEHINVTKVTTNTCAPV